MMLQVFLSRVDQGLHGEDLPADGHTAQEAIADLESQMTVFPFASSGAPVHARYALKSQSMLSHEADAVGHACFMLLPNF